MSERQRVRSHGPDLKDYFLRILSNAKIPFKKQGRVNFVINGFTCILSSANSSYKQNHPFKAFFWGITARYLDEMKDPNAKLILICGRNFGSLEANKIPEYPDFKDGREADRFITGPPLLEHLFVFDLPWIKKLISETEPTGVRGRPRRNITIYTKDMRMIIERIEISKLDLESQANFRLDKLKLSNEQIKTVKEEFESFQPKSGVIESLERIAYWLLEHEVENGVEDKDSELMEVLDDNHIVTHELEPVPTKLEYEKVNGLHFSIKKERSA